jgi:hypothetical protein
MGLLINESPGDVGASRSVSQEEKLLTETSVAERLAKLEEKYLHELLPEEERLELRERILRLKAKAGDETKARG